MYISKLGIKSFLLFLFFLLMGRLFLFPFGDEPDFEVRAYELVKEEVKPWWTPFYLFDSIFREFNFYNNCKTDSTFFSYWSNISEVDCNEDISQSFSRYIITVISVIPIFLLIIFRKLSLKFVNIIGQNFSKDEWFHRLDVLSVVFLFSGFIYYIGVLAVEQFVLVLTLPIFLFWGRWLIVSLFILLIFFLDMGNSIVLLTFVLITYSFSKLSKRNIILCSSILILAALVLGISSVSMVANVEFLSEKATAIADAEEQLGLRDKYPIYLRPIITYMTGIFFTPSGVKVIPVFVIYSFFIVKFFYKKKYVNFDDKRTYKNFVFLSGALTTMLFFIFILPNYSNAKYYIFMLPYLLYSVYSIKDKKRTLNVIIIMNCILYFHLLLFRL